MIFLLCLTYFSQLFFFFYSIMGFPGGSVIKNPPANAGDAGVIPGSGLENEMATHSSILAWEVP